MVLISLVNLANRWYYSATSLDTILFFYRIYIANAKYASSVHGLSSKLYSKYSNVDQSFGLFPLYGAQCQVRLCSLFFHHLVSRFSLLQQNLCNLDSPIPVDISNLNQFSLLAFKWMRYHYKVMCIFHKSRYANLVFFGCIDVL